jgi:hypothetical protein
VVHLLFRVRSYCIFSCVIARSKSILVSSFSSFQLSAPLQFQLRPSWKELYKLANAFLPAELAKHQRARQQLNLDDEDCRIQMLDDFFQGVPPDRDGEYTSFVPYAPPKISF